MIGRKKRPVVLPRSEGQFARPWPGRPYFPTEWGKERANYYVHVAEDGHETRHAVPPTEAPFLTVYLFGDPEGAFEATATFDERHEVLPGLMPVQSPGADWTAAGRDIEPVTFWRRPHSADRYASGGGEND